VELVPTLLSLAGSSELSRPALAAPARMPEGAVESIVAVAARAELDDELRVRLFDVLAEIGGRAASRALWDFFRVSGELPTQVAAGRALQRLALDESLSALAEEGFAALFAELREKIALLNRICDEIGARDPETVQLLRDHQWLEVERLFQLLSLRHDARTLRRARFNLESPQEVLRANALELLEALLPRALALEVAPLLEPLVEQRIPMGDRLSRDSALALLEQDPWLRVVTQRWLLGDAEGSMAVTLAAGSGSELSVDLRWAEELALAPIQAQVVDLKKVPLFQGVPADSLVSLAKVVRTTQLAEGDVLFEQGAQGDSMYLIQLGEARVEVDGVEVARVGAGEVLGEMAVIDGQPRSARCVATKMMVLVEISAADFSSLVRTHASAAMAVLRSLSVRLRKASTRGLQGGRDTARGAKPSSRASLLPGESGGLATLIEGCSFLRAVELFAELEQEELVKIAELATSMTVYPGEVLFEQGEQGDSMFLVRSGRISVRIDGAEVAVVGARDPLGEMALIDGQPRSASCFVLEEALVMRIDAEDFNLLLDTQPDIAIGLMKTLSLRLRQVN
jgi:CRP-like cAMP-binding protein